MRTKSYLVTWEIDISAMTPREAAWEALDIQRDAGSFANVFTVKTKRGKPVEIDLEVAEEGDPV